MNVEDVMTREVVTVPPGASLKKAARLLVEHRISGMPVVDAENHVLGVLSEADVLPKEAAGLQLHAPPARRPGLAGDVDRSKLEVRLVGEAMTASAETIEPQRPVALAAARMIERGINRLPVVDEGRLVGIVTRADLIQAFVRTDAEIAQEIREDVVVRGLRLERHSVQVEVQDGEVTLTGMLDSRADAESLAALANRVPGVVGVHSRLAWSDTDPEC